MNCIVGFSIPSLPEGGIDIKKTRLPFALLPGLLLAIPLQASGAEYDLKEDDAKTESSSQAKKVALAREKRKSHTLSDLEHSETAGTETVPSKLRISILTAAQAIAQTALLEASASTGTNKTTSANNQNRSGKFSSSPLSLVGKPGDVRLVCMSTSVIKREKEIVPKWPIPPFSTWSKWLEENEHTARHCALDWVDDQGQWWHTEMRGFFHHPDKYRVGEGEHIASGVRIYGIFIMPGRTHPEGENVILDELIKCDYRIIVREAKKYARKDKRRGEPGTGGKGTENVGLGGPCFRPSQCSNTYINYLLRKAGVKRKAPPGAIGWDTVPRFPYSSDADAYE